ncbi:MAG: efflux RND transporter periplasmic adaptor subunit, partial [Proteobacteria bacterium]|nr:efflux RND transporter periplasmic adaptor subunit [Pseudomonadota bacterium]
MAQRPKKRKWLIILLLLLVAYVAYKKLLPGGPGGWGGGAPPVSVAQVLERPVREWHEYSGRITSVDQAEVRPRVSGVIQEVRLAEGTLVQQGDVLFVIDPRPFAAAVTAAEGLLGSAQARLALARADMVRAQKLIKENAIPQFQFDQTRNALNVAEAGVKTAQAELDVAQLNYDYAFVKAPIGGRVSRAEITAGNLVETGPNTPLLTTVVAAGQVYADFDLDEQTFLEYARAHMADDTEATRTIPVKLALMGDEKPSHSGYMKSFDNRINLSTGTIRGRALLENPGGQLVAGMFARIYIGSPQEKPSLLITDRA